MSRMRNTNFLLLFFGRLVSRLGDAVFTLGVAWYILELTGSALVMGSFIAVVTITMVLAGPIGGNIVDQFKKIRLLYLMDFVRGLVVIVAAFTILLSDNVTLILVVMYIMAVVSALCTVVFNPASSAIVPLIMTKEELLKANSLMSITGSVTSIFGIVLGATMYAFLGPFGVLLVDGISYILSGISEMFIKADEPNITKEKVDFALNEQFQIFKEGFRYLLRKKGLIFIGIYAAVLNFSLVPTFQVYQPFLINIILEKDIKYLAIFSIATSLGMLAGGLGMSITGMNDKEFDLIKLLRRFSALLILFLGQIAFVVYSVIFLGMNFNTFLVGYVMIAFCIGALVALINIPIETYIQEKTDPQMMGRVNSTIGMMSMISQPIAILVGSTLVEIISIEFAYIFSVIVLVLSTTLLLFRSEFNEDKKLVNEEC